MLPFLRDLMAHSEWANAVFFHAWDKSPARDDEDMRRRLSHLTGVQLGFLAMFNNQEPGGPKPGPPLSFDELKTRAETGHAGLRICSQQCRRKGYYKRFTSRGFLTPLV